MGAYRHTVLASIAKVGCHRADGNKGLKAAVSDVVIRETTGG